MLDSNLDYDENKDNIQIIKSELKRLFETYYHVETIVNHVNSFTVKNELKHEFELFINDQFFEHKFTSYNNRGILSFTSL